MNSSFISRVHEFYLDNTFYNEYHYGPTNIEQIPRFARNDKFLAAFASGWGLFVIFCHSERNKMK